MNNEGTRVTHWEEAIPTVLTGPTSGLLRLLARNNFRFARYPVVAQSMREAVLC